VVHRGQTQDRERMHRVVKREIEEERRRQECADNGDPCAAKPPSKLNEADDEERRKRECAERGGPCVPNPKPA